MSIEKCYNYDLYNKKLYAYMNIFINDTVIQELFTHINRRKFDPMEDVVVTCVCAVSALTIIGFPIIVGLGKFFPNKTFYKLHNFNTNWEPYANLNNNLPVWPGISSYSCHDNNKLCLIGMDDLIESLEEINTVLIYFTTKLNITSKIHISSDIIWQYETDLSIKSTKKLIRTTYK